MMDMTNSSQQACDQDFEVFKRKLHRLVGIDLNHYKEAQMKRRIGSFMVQAGADRFLLFYNLLEKDPQLKKKFVDYLTINVSELFRDAALFAELKNLIIPELLKRSPRLSVWSAGCSIGAEAYTMAIMLNELTPHARHRIFGTDLDEEIVKRAHQGVYSRDEVRQVAPEILGKYFTLNDGKYYVQDEIKRRVTFTRHNLLTDSFESGLDLILCRNVVIYFTNEAKEMLYKKFYDALKPGGVLFVGGTETILNYQSIGFKLTRTFFYEKPL